MEWLRGGLFACARTTARSNPDFARRPLSNTTGEIMNPKYLMDMHSLSPKKSLGQNFLHDPQALEKIVAAADLPPNATVLEIGPGTGALTVHLAQKAARVVAVEIDDRLFGILERQLRDFTNVRLVHADILETNL